MGTERKQVRSEEALEALVRALAVGQWKDGSPLPPTRLLEKQLGVSHATMIKVLRMAAVEGLLTVAPRQPATVRASAAKRAKEMLRSFGRQRAGRCLAVLIPERIWPPDNQTFYNDLKPAIDAEAARAGWVVEPVCWPVIEQTRFVEDLPAAGFSAAMPIGISTDYIESLHVLRRRQFPTVVWNCDFPQIPLPAILLDEVGGTRQIAGILANLGHRSLCLATWALDSRMKHQGHRVAAWLDYLAETGLLATCTLPVLHLTRASDGRANLADGLLAVKMRPTAIVFAYAAAATAFLVVSGHGQLRIPEQLSLATFGLAAPSPETSWCPPLTTVWCDMGHLARAAIDMVSRLCDGRPCETILMPMSVHTTGSIAAPPETPWEMPGPHRRRARR